MQHGRHNLVSSTRRMRHNVFQQSVIAGLVAFSMLLPSPAMAVQMGTLKQNNGFKVVILAIANLNFAMKQASDNPMDGWRRQNVAHAMSMLPPAILLLSKEFKKSNLHDKDLPFVQSILGGFIDKSMVGKVQNFMKNPTKDNIPSVGANFPKEALQQAEKSYIRMDEGKDGNGPAVSADDAEPKHPGVSDAQLASLDSLEGVFGKSFRKSEPKVKSDKATLGMDEGAAGGKDGLDASELDGAWDPKAAQSSGKFKEEISKEIDSVEEKLSVSTIRKPASKADEDSSEDEAFFKAKKKSNATEKGLRGKKSKKHPAGDKTSFLNGGRKHPVAFVIEAILSTMDQALADPPPASPTPGAEAQGPKSGGKEGGGEDGKCKDCGGGGGGGSGGGGGGGGGQAAQILQGLAMMMMAAAPMVAAAVTADADKKIARLNSQTQIQLATMTAQSARYMADNQKALAEFQAKTTEAIADKKNEKDLTVLKEQLASMKYSQDQQRQSEQEKRALEDKYNQQRIELAQRQADDNLNVARQTLSAQLTQAGLSTGFKNTRDSGGRLDVNRIGGGSLVASTGFAGSSGGSVGSTLSGTGAGTGSSTGVQASGGGGLAAQLGQMGGGPGAQALGFTSQARGRLLSSATLTMNDSKGAKILDPKTGAYLSQSGGTTARGVKVAGIANRGFNNGTATLAQGSTRGFHQSAPKQGAGDVNSFLALTTPNSFTDYRNTKKASVPVTAGLAHSPLSTGAQVYNARGIREVSPAYDGGTGGGHGLSLGAMRLR